MKLLSELLDDYNSLHKIKILGMASDSREVLPGYLFAAFNGNKINGIKFIPEAIKNGAVAILLETAVDINNKDICLITDNNPRRRFAKIVSRFYDKQPEWVCAVTGTNGKTSVSNFVTQIWEQLNKKSIAIGTLGIGNLKNFPSINLTTPEPIALHKSLCEITESGVTHAIIEASSHGLHQFRLDGIKCSAGAFTNLSHDHLDYHGSLEDYLLAKERLFAEIIDNEGYAILNHDNHEFDRLSKISKLRNLNILSYGRNSRADLKLISTEPHSCGQRIKINVFGKEFSILLPVYGNYQSINALCALGLVLASGVNEHEAIEALGHLRGVTGRLDLVVQLPNRAKIFVDYAHTPDALKHSLLALREHTKGNVSAVFGCGGDRDIVKRLTMGKIANDFADTVYITDDNPRSENPQNIRNSILEGCPDGIEVGDRRKAIQIAVSNLNPGDVLIVAGKGHETGQVIGKKLRPFNDIDEVKKAAAMLREFLI